MAMVIGPRGFRGSWFGGRWRMVLGDWNAQERNLGKKIRQEKKMRRVVMITSFHQARM
jgi:hypothetical protein